MQGSAPSLSRNALFFQEGIYKASQSPKQKTTTNYSSTYTSLQYIKNSLGKTSLLVQTAYAVLCFGEIDANHQFQKYLTIFNWMFPCLQYSFGHSHQAALLFITCLLHLCCKKFQPVYQTLLFFLKIPDYLPFQPSQYALQHPKVHYNSSKDRHNEVCLGLTFCVTDESRTRLCSSHSTYLFVWFPWVMVDDSAIISSFPSFERVIPEGSLWPNFKTYTKYCQPIKQHRMFALRFHKNQILDEVKQKKKTLPKGVI